MAAALERALEEQDRRIADRIVSLQSRARALGLLLDEPSPAQISSLIDRLSARLAVLGAEEAAAAAESPILHLAKALQGGVVPPLPLQHLTRPNQRFILQGGGIAEQAVQDLFDLLGAAQAQGPAALPLCRRTGPRTPGMTFSGASLCASGIERRDACANRGTAGCCGLIS